MFRAGGAETTLEGFLIEIRMEKQSADERRWKLELSWWLNNLLEISEKRQEKNEKLVAERGL